MSQSRKTELCEGPAGGSAETLGALGRWLGSSERQDYAHTSRLERSPVDTKQDPVSEGGGP